MEPPSKTVAIVILRLWLTITHYGEEGTELIKAVAKFAT